MTWMSLDMEVIVINLQSGSVLAVKCLAQWLSWLERRPVTAKVVGSSPIWVVIWGLSSAGRASALQAEGHRFEPYRPHLI